MNNNITSCVWEISYQCNLHCLTCRMSDIPFRNQRQPETVSFATAYHILNELITAGIKRITFVGGEPFLSPHLIPLLSEAKRHGITTAVVTNGSELSRYRANDLAPCLDILIVSLDGPPDIHDRIRRRDGLTQLLISELNRLQKEKKSQQLRHPFLYLYATISSFNYPYLPSLIEIAQRLNVRKLRLQAISVVTPQLQQASSPIISAEDNFIHSYSVSPDLNLTPPILEQIRKIRPKLESQAGRSGLHLEWEKIFTDYPKFDYCNFIKKNIIISPNGKVYLCPMFPQWTVGNLFQNSLKDILKSDSIQSCFQKIHNNFPLPICRACCVEKVPGLPTFQHSSA